VAMFPLRGGSPRACGKNYPLSLTEMFPEAITPAHAGKTLAG